MRWWVAAFLGIAGDELESLGKAMQRCSARIILRLLAEEAADEAREDR